MSSIQKRKVALDFLLDGKDRLTNLMQNNYSKYYGDYLFTEKSVLKNLRDASMIVQKADKIINYVDNIDKKDNLNKQSIYAKYFSGLGRTAPVSPKKKNNLSERFSSEISQNSKPKHTITLNLKTQNSSSPYHQQLDTSNSNISHNKLNLQLSDLYDSQIINQALLRDDKLYIDSVQQNNLQSIKIHDTLKIKQLKEKERIYQNSNSFGNSGMGSHRSNSMDTFIPYGKERNNQGFIIEPITQYGIEQNALIKRKLSNIPMEKQRISTVVPPSQDKVLVIKRGLHFFDRGIGLKSKGDNKNLLLNTFKKNINTDKVLTQDDNNQTSEYLQQQQQQICNQQMSNNLNIHRMNNVNSITKVKQNDRSSSMVQDLTQQIWQNSTSDQKNLLKNDKIIQKSELNSSNYLESDTTTIQNSIQARNNSLESVLPSIDQNKLNRNNQQLTNQQIGKYYIPNGVLSPNKQVHNINFKQNTSEGRPNSSTQINQASSILQFSKNENSRQILTEQETDSQILNNPTQFSLCGNPQCINHTEGIISKSSGIKEELNDKQHSKSYRKNSSMGSVQYISQTNIQNKNSQGHVQSKTMTFDNNNNINVNKNNKIVLEEKIDEVSSKQAGQDIYQLKNPDQFQCMDVKMKQHENGKVSDFHIGKFVLVTDQNDEREEEIINTQQNEDLFKNSVLPQKKTLYNLNVHFNWKMNALDEAQLIELMKKEKESKAKLPKIFIYNKKKYTTDQNPAPGEYDPNYNCIEKHSHQVLFSKANLSKTQSSQQIKQNNESSIQQTPIIPKQKNQNNTQSKEEGYEIMFSELMKDIKKEVTLQKVQNKDLQHPMNGLQLKAIPHSNITELNKNFSHKMTYCKQCLNSLRYYLVQDNPTIQKKQTQNIILFLNYCPIQFNDLLKSFTFIINTIDINLQYYLKYITMFKDIFIYKIDINLLMNEVQYIFNLKLLVNLYRQLLKFIINLLIIIILSCKYFRIV